MENTAKQTKTYVLKDKSVNKYLYGEVYSNYSPDEHWVKYLELKPEGKELFMVLPEGVDRTDADQEAEEEFKKKELSDSQTTEGAAGDEVKDIAEVDVTEESVNESENSEETENSQTTEGAAEEIPAVVEKPKRGRTKQA